MPGIISGRVHNAIYLSPELNLNKLIKPDFSIFRVCDVGEDHYSPGNCNFIFQRIRNRTEYVQTGGRDDNYRMDLDYLAKTTFILGRTMMHFLIITGLRLIETKIENVFVNRWKSRG